MEVNISESFTDKAVISSTPSIVVPVKKTPELVIDQTGQYFSGNYCKFTGQSFELKNEVQSLEFCADKCLKNEICDVFTYNSNFSKRICSLKELKKGTIDYDAFLNCGYIVGRKFQGPNNTVQTTSKPAIKMKNTFLDQIWRTV